MSFITEDVVDPDQAIRLRRAISMLARQLNTSATDEGLTPSQASVLALVANRGPISLGELARLEHINPTMLSRVVGRLDEMELVVRTPDPGDLRSASLTATDRGHEIHQRIRDQRGAAVSRGAARLGSREQAALTRALPALEQLATALGTG
jgi:DNA-binding MarR family transcriptional regulator